MRIALNNDWMFCESFSPEHLHKNFDSSDFTQVRLPHTVVETPYNCFEEKLYEKLVTYWRVITVNQIYEDQVTKLTFEGAGHGAEVYLDGQLIGEHFGGYTAFTLDITPYVVHGKEHSIIVKLNSYENQNFPPFGHVIDFMTYGGLYREVYLEIFPETYLENLFIYTEDVLEKKKKIVVSGEIKGKNKNQAAQYTLSEYFGKNSVVIGEKTFEEESFEHTFSVEDIQLWDLENPNLYVLEIELKNSFKVKETIGFREIKMTSEGFYLNQKRIKLRGLNRHQSYPYVGYAMPESAQRLDAEILKKELGVNAVRTSHYPQSKHFIRACDEIGLLVFTEIPGWQHIGDEKWQEFALKHVEEMVIQYRNHPSIFIWGVRINESPDHHEFYKKTNALARKLDPTRLTGGVRFIKNSELLEDVYTYNDFSHVGDNPGIEKRKQVTTHHQAPYIVSEYNGHMFPTKAFDSEAHRTEHALRHARVIQAISKEEGALGGFGWCMFDYNTHKDFGSGDRICYHGVMDAFRNPKLAASVYASQQSESPVLEISSQMDVGEYPGSIRGMVYAFTNGDEVKVYKNNVFIKSFKREQNNGFQAMANGPIVIDDFLGNQLESEKALSPGARMDLKKLLLLISQYGPQKLPFKGKILGLKMMMIHKMTLDDIGKCYTRYIGDWGQEATAYTFKAFKKGKEIASVEKSASSKPNLEIKVDRTHLIEKETYDLASIRIRCVSDDHQLMPYMMEAIHIETQGPIEVIGPKTLSLRGGMTGTYIRSIAQEGHGKIIFTMENRGSWEKEFYVSIQKKEGNFNDSI